MTTTTQDVVGGGTPGPVEQEPAGATLRSAFNDSTGPTC